MGKLSFGSMCSKTKDEDNWKFVKQTVVIIMFSCRKGMV